jgi:hypothetical protein
MRSSATCAMEKSVSNRQKPSMPSVNESHSARR